MASRDHPDNPYADTLPQMPAESSGMPGSGGLVNQVMVVGILQIVFGAMELMMGGFLLFYAVLFAFVMPQIENANAEPMPPEAMFWVSIGCAVGGSIVFCFAVLRIITGVYSFWFRQRGLMLVSLIGGTITILTCYCSLFSVGMCIYGLIVMLDPSVKLAYQLAAEGVSADEIKARFARARFGF